MLKIPFVFLILGCLPVGCATEAATPPQVSAAVVTGVHHAMCGCSIDEIGSCGNYVEIDGDYVKLVHDSLSPMQFCAHKKAGVDIEVVGEMKDGQFIAESWQLAR